MSPCLEIAGLALCLETAEAAGCEAKLKGLEAYDARAYRHEIARVGRTILFSAPMSRRNSSYNRAMVFSRSDREHLDNILRWLRERDAYWFDVAPVLVDDLLLQALVDDGLHIATLTNVVAMAPIEPESQPCQGIEVQEVDLYDPDQLRGLGVVVHHGIEFPQSLVEAMHRTKRAEYAVPAWHTYLATLDGAPTALAAAHIAGGIATIDDLNAIPQYEGRGCRAALLRRCIADAARAGCAWIAGRAKPDSEIEKTMADAGFEIVYTKRLYARESRAHYDP